MNILITGVAGFIGSHIAERLLSLGHNVYGVDNFNDYYCIDRKKMNAKAVEMLGGEVIKMDMRNENEFSLVPNDVEYIFHFAAQPGISTTSTFEDYLSNNVIATKNLIDFAKNCQRLKLFVNIGTSSIYGLEATSAEDVMVKPASHYGVTKLAAEQLVLQQARNNCFRGCSLRLYSVIGPRERPEKMYTKLIDLGIKGQPFPLYEGSEKHLRSFTYVGDIVDGVVSVLDKELLLDGEIINLGSELEHTTLEGIKAVEYVLGKKITIRSVGKREGDQMRTKANITKAKRLLNYQPSTSLIESVRQQVAWYKANF